MNRRMKIMGIALLIIFGSLIGLNIIKAIFIKIFFSHFEMPPVYVSTVKAAKRSWIPKLSAVGNFVAINGVEVNSEVAGKIVAIHFDSGQYIENAMPLIDLDDTVDQASLKFALAEKSLKEINYKRQSDLLKRNATSGSNLDEAKASFEQANANVEKIQSVIKQKHISSPFAGKLGIRQVNLGQYVTPGTTSVVTLQSLDPLYLEFSLPEQFFRQVHINQAIEFTVEQYPGLKFLGKITALNSKIDASTHNILIHATVPNCPRKALANLADSLKLISIQKSTDDNLKIIDCNSEKNIENKVSRFAFIPGMFADLTIKRRAIPNLIILPSTAISYSLYGNSVFVISKTGKKDKNSKEIFVANRVYVNTGEQEGNYTVIKSGISAGQEVVSSGELKLQNGTRVVVSNDMPLKTHKIENLSQ